MAENTAFVFVPLVALALYRLWGKTSLKNVMFLTVSLSLLVLSHPFMFVIFVPFYFLYILSLGSIMKKIRYLLISIILCMAFTSFYSIPLLMENKYTHYDISPFNGAGYALQFISFEKLILPVWNFIDQKGKLEYQTYQIGILQLLIFLFSIPILGWYTWKKRIHSTTQILAWIGIVNFILSIFLSLPYSDSVYKLFPILQRIEYPWRYLSLNLFSLAIIAAILIHVIEKKGKKIALSIIIIVIGIYLYLPHAKGHDYKNIPDSFYLYNIVENTDAFATLPRLAAQPDSYEKVPTRYKIISGDATVTTLVRTSSRHIYEVETNGGIRFLDATFYFPGWKVFIDDNPADVEFQDPDFRGLITFNIPSGKHTIDVVFTSTKVRMLADLISISALILTAIFIFFTHKKK